jgi:hypothetical protein
MQKGKQTLTAASGCRSVFNKANSVEQQRRNKPSV